MERTLVGRRKRKIWLRTKKRGMMFQMERLVELSCYWGRQDQQQHKGGRMNMVAMIQHQ